MQGRDKMDFSVTDELKAALQGLFHLAPGIGLHAIPLIHGDHQCTSGIQGKPQHV